MLINNISKKYSENSLHKMVVDYLIDDGVVCDYYNKDYNEQETYKNPKGSRLAFKKYNDKINEYHNLLKLLNGERRVNIYESIPIIDFITKSNTGFKYHYNINNDTVDSNFIQTISQGSESCLDLLKSEDAYTINRVLTNQKMAEHFYNTSSETSSNYNIQASANIINKAYYYRGIYEYQFNNNLNVNSGQLYTDKVIRENDVYYLIPIIEEKITFKFSEMTPIGSITKKFNGVNIVCNDNGDFIVNNANYSQIKRNGNQIFTVSTNDNSYIQATLNEGDLLVILPSSTYSIECTKLLFFYKVNDGYNLFVVYIDSFTPTKSMIKLSTDDLIYDNTSSSDNLLVKSSVLSLLQNYVQIDIVNYANNSGIMNGLFCEPYEYNNDTVSKWKFVNDSEIATNNGGSITNGTLYYQGHLLNRGNFIDSPLKLTSNDPTHYTYKDDVYIPLKNVGNNYYNYLTNEKYSGDSKDIYKYNGKTRVYYDMISNNVLDFFKPYEKLSIDDYINSTKIFTLDTVVTKSNYSSNDIGSNEYNRLTAKSLYNNGNNINNIGGTWDRPINAYLKFQNSDGTAKNINEILNFLTSYYEHLSDDGKTLKVDLTNTEECSYTMNYLQDQVSVTTKGALWWKKKKTTVTSDVQVSSSSVGTGTDIYQDVKKLFYVTYESKHDRYGDVKGSGEKRCENPTVTVLSPLDAFSLYTDEKDTLQDYTTSTSTSGGGFTTGGVVAGVLTGGISALFGFGKKETQTVISSSSSVKINKLGKNILVWGDYNKYVPNKLLLITHEDIGLEIYNEKQNNNSLCTFMKDDKAISFKVTNRMEFAPSKVRTLSIKVPADKVSGSVQNFNYINKNMPNGLMYYTGTEEQKGIFGITTTKEHIVPLTQLDCYIYILEPVSLDLDQINLYDINNNRITMSNVTSDFSIFPFSSENYFNCEKDLITNDSSSHQYVLTTSGQNDLNNINEANIVVGLPQLNNKNDVNIFINKYIGKVSMSPLGRLFKSDFTAISQSIINNLIFNYPLSDGQNYFRFGYLTQTIGDLLNAESLLENLSEYGYVTVDSTVYNMSDFKKLLNHLRQSEYYNNINSYDVNLDLSKIDTSKYISGGNLKYNFVDTLNNLLSDNVLSVSLNSINVDSKIRPSLEEMYNALKGTFESDKILSSSCDLIDNYLGNNTKAFIKLGDEYVYKVNDTEYTLSESENFTKGLSDISSKLTELTYEIACGFTNRLEVPTDIYNNVTIVDTVNEISTKENNVTYYVKNDNKEYKIVNNTKQEMTFIGIKFINLIKNYLTKFYTELSVNNSQNALSLNYDFSKLVGNFTTEPMQKFLNDLLNLSDTSFKEYVNNLNNKLNTTVNNNLNSGEIPLSLYEYAKDVVNINNTYINLKNDFSSSTVIVDKLFLNYNYTVVNKLPSNYTINTLYYNLSDKLYYVCDTDITQIREVSYSENFKKMRGEIINLAKKYTVSNLIDFYGELNKYYNYPTPRKVNNYIMSLSDDVSKINITPNIISDKVDSYTLSYNLPSYNEKSTVFTVSDKTWQNKKLNKLSDSIYDISYDTLTAISNSIVKSLGNGVDSKDVYNTSDDTKTSNAGKSSLYNTLYYKRFKMLNNRLNRMNGSLALASRLLNSKKYLQMSSTYNEELVDSYKNIMTVIPVSKIDELVYLKRQVNETQTETIIPSKFIYKNQLESLAEMISDKCVLTCTKCSVKDSCPFYNENELLKQYCTPAQTLNIYLKDNKLDMIYYDNTSNNSNNPQIKRYNVINNKRVALEGENGKFDLSKFDTINYPYGEIKKLEDVDSNVTYTVRDLNEIKTELKQINEFAENEENLNWLVGGRYGSVDINPLYEINESTTENDLQILKYTYLYDALFLSDTETYIDYSVSDDWYNVEYEQDGVVSSGKVKLNLPVGVSAFTNANKNDDVFLVSDDDIELYDSNGNKVLPVIYLNTVGNLNLTFGIDKNPSHSLESENDSILYASDIAQWSFNMTKKLSSNVSDVYENKDQYYMDKIYKKLQNSNGENYYIETNGREKMSSGYNEVLTNESNLDESKIISNKPIVADYKDFIRKVGIKMYDVAKNYYDTNANKYSNDNESLWQIKFIKGDIKTANTEELKELKRQILPQMQTNLRLVIVKN